MFPDFPGCVSADDTFDAALSSGGEALAAHVDLMRSDGDAIPEPRSLEAIKAAQEDWIEWNGAVVAVVPLLPPPARAVRVNISVEQALLGEIDAAAQARGTTRSGFLSDVARQALGHV
jgi:predicted RNase H-like HicB family nuclease